VSLWITYTAVDEHVVKYLKHEMQRIIQARIALMDGQLKRSRSHHAVGMQPAPEQVGCPLGGSAHHRAAVKTAALEIPYRARREQHL